MVKEYNEKHFFMVFIVAVIFKYSHLGFMYTPFLDDFVQYGLYPYTDNVWHNVLIGGVKAVYTRPIACISDVYLWGRLDIYNLGIALFIITVLHGISGTVIYKVLRKIDIQVTPIFLIIYTFLPLGIEGTYWVSASSRIVCSMFLMSLSALELVRYIERKKELDLILFIILNLLSCGFYEQTAVLSLAFLFFVIIRLKKYLLLLVPCINILIVFMFYLFLSKFGNNGDRIEIIKAVDIFDQLIIVTKKFFEIWTTYHFPIYTKGIYRSIKLILNEKSFLWILGLLSVISLWFYTCKDLYINDKGSRRYKAILGLILFILPYAPFLLIRNDWFNFRNTNASFIGLALAVDGVLNRIFSNKKILNVIGTLILTVFIVATVSEINDYYKTGQLDLELAADLAKKAEQKNDNIIYYKIDAPIYIEQNSPFNDHIMRITGSDWGVSGAVRGVSKNGNITVIEQKK